MSTAPTNYSYKQFLFVFGLVLICCLLYWAKPPVSFIFDPNTEKCLPDFHLGIFVRSSPPHVARDDLVVFKPFGAVSYVKNEYVIKMARGLPGDHLVVRDGVVSINDKVVASGLPLGEYYYHKQTAAFDRDEIIPKGNYFLMGTNPASDDSRYWGYAPDSALSGYVLKIW